MTLTDRKGLRIHIVPHSHIDTEWYWDRGIAEAFGAKAIGAALKIMGRDDCYCFSQDQVTIIEPVLRNLPDDQANLIREMISASRFEIVGGMYVQPEVAEPHGECLIRQILYGKRWFMDKLGVDVRCAWNIDTFGQCTQLPQILAKAGYRYMVFSRGMPPRITREMPSEFIYESPDGSRILTHWMAGHYCGGEDNIKGLLSTVCEHRTTDVIMIPWGCDITVPAKDSGVIESIVRKAAIDLGMDVDWVGTSTPSRFFEDLLSFRPRHKVITMDFNPPLGGDLRGTYDNRIELKKLNREAEMWMLCAEKLATLSWLKGAEYPDDLDDLWISLIYNHFHDIIGGSHYDAVYRGAMERLTRIRDRCSMISRESAVRLVKSREGSGQVMVINPLSYPRTEICSLTVSPDLAGADILDDEGMPIPVRRTEIGSDGGCLLEFLTQDLPPFGHRTYQLRREGSEGLITELDSHTIENEYLLVSMDIKTGSLSRILHKKSGWEVLAGPGNELVGVEEDEPELEGELSLTDRVHHLTDFGRPSITAFTDGIGSWIQAKGSFRHCKIIQRALLYRGLPRVDFETFILDYEGGDEMMEVRFPLNLEWDKVRAGYETPFAITERPLGEHFCAQTFVDCWDGRGGTALINRGTPGYWARTGSLDMVLLRSFRNYRGYVRGRRKLGLECDDDDSRCVLAREHGDHAFRYSLYPHIGSWQESGVVGLSHSYNSPPLCIVVEGVGKSFESFIRCRPDNFEIVSLKRTNDSLIVRGYETWGRACEVSLKLPFKPCSAWISTMLESPQETALVKGNCVNFSCAPNEIVTLRIKRKETICRNS